MSWATEYIKALQGGKTVSFRPRGNSMNGVIESGNLCTVSPVLKDEALKTHDIVLCRVNGRHYLHLIRTVQGERYQIRNAKGHINGWIGRNDIYGICIGIAS